MSHEVFESRTLYGSAAILVEGSERHSDHVLVIYSQHLV